MKERFIIIGDPQSGKVDTILTEEDEAWIPNNAAQVRFGPCGETVIFGSERTGFCHLYSLVIQSQEITPLTQGEWEVRDWQISEDRRVILFTSNRDDLTEKHIYRLDLPTSTEKEIKPFRVTAEKGWFWYNISENGERAAVLFADLTTPFDLYWCYTNRENPLKRLTKSFLSEYNEYEWAVPEFISIPTDSGQTIQAKIWKPRDFGEQKKYPLVVYVHGAGYTQSVHKAPWWHRDISSRILAQNGYLVLDLDYRGSSGYGRKWRVDVYRHTGGLDLEDEVTGVKYCIQKGWADADRVGIWGWSYGGFMTEMAMFKKPEIFKVGCSVAGVADWKNYNLWYTTQRFNSPEEDSLAFKQSSPITYAEGLKGKLLLIHGMKDSNVHFQDTAQLIHRLIKLEKDFDVMIYPREEHGFSRDESYVHVYSKILEYFDTYLK